MGTNRTLGILVVSLVSWMHWAVLPRREECRTGVATVAVGIGRCGIVVVIGGTVPGILFCVMRWCTCFVDFSACFVVGFGAFIMGAVFDI